MRYENLCFLFKLYKKYDLTVNLTASDRSVLYAIIAGKKSISAVERENSKSWWKKIFLTSYYYFDTTKHILLNNLESLNLLKIKHDNIQLLPDISNVSIDRVKKKLSKKGIKDFVIFHPSAQYKYKIYNQFSRDKLLTYLSSLGLSIVITGSNNKIDSEIKLNLPSLPNVFDFISETTLEEYFALSSLSLAYIGMDTLNMHIAASQNKRIFAIFGPTNLSMWSPWSNQLELSAKDLSVDIIDYQEMVELGMGALLGVSQGSKEPPKLIVMRYFADQGNESEAIGILGKGITFDSGGLDIKSAAGMRSMKGDMAGGAAVIASMKAITMLGLKANVIGIVPATENMPGGSAQRPGDVVKTMDGKTSKTSHLH